MGSEAEWPIVRPGAGYEGKQGLSYGAGVSAESAGASGLCLHTWSSPGWPRQGPPARAPRIGDLPTRGEGEMWWARASPTTSCERRDFVYIRPGSPTCRQQDATVR
jgi:uncharacterized RmlC-like cupin family protein